MIKFNTRLSQILSTVFLSENTNANQAHKILLSLYIELNVSLSNA